VIEFRSISKRFDDGTLAVEDFSLVLPSRQTTVLVDGGTTNTSFLIDLVDRREVTFEHVGEIDIDTWAVAPALAVLGDTSLMILDAFSGEERSRVAVSGANHAKWIGPGWLLVVEPTPDEQGMRSRIRVLDVVSGRWTEPVIMPEITRLAVRGDEIHVGYATQSIAVWDRTAVCRGIGAVAFIAQSPGDHGTGASAEPVRQPVATGIAKA
jgi:hypothetical protein